MNTLPRLSALCAALVCAASIHPSAAAAEGATGPRVVDALPSQEIGGMWPVKVDMAALRSAQAGQRVHFALPDGRTLDVVFDARLGGEEGRQWIGHHVAGRQYAVRLRLDDTGVAGVIRTPEGSFVLGRVDGTQLMGNDLSRAGVPIVLDGLPAMFSTADADGDRTAADVRRGARARAVEPPADVAHPVDFNLIAMSALNPGDEVMLSIPEHGDYRVSFDGSDAGAAGTSTWVGHLKDYGSEFRVIITSGPDGSVGNILTPSGELMLVESGGRQWLVDPVRSGLTHYESEHVDAVGAEVAAGGVTADGNTAAATTGSSSTTSGTTTGTTSSGSTTTIDVLVLYTPGFVSRHGSLHATRIAQLIALGNQAYKDSNVPITLRLVGSEQISIADTTSNSTTLSALAAGSGSFSGVPALRRKYGADLVTLIRPFYMSAQGGSCGVGYVGGYNGANIANYAAYGYSVVSDGRDVAGSSYYCTDYTFTHELGHNMGLMHDRATVAKQGGGQGSHPYAYGHGRSGSFGTVMSYISPVIGRFSNPDISTCGGSNACGVPITSAQSAHNALALNNNRNAVANWMSVTVATRYQISGTVSRAGRALANVAMTASSGASCGATGSNGAYTCSVPAGWTGSIAPRVSGTIMPGRLSFANVRAAVTRGNFVVR